MSTIVEVKIEETETAVGGVGGLADTLLAAKGPTGKHPRQQPPRDPNGGVDSYPFPTGTMNQPPR